MSRALIVDDNPANIDLLRKILGQEGVDITFALSGHKALEIAEKKPPEIILLDIMMPHMDGYETCVRMRQLENLKAIPVIFVTAKTEAEDVKKAFEAGGNDYIHKPIRAEEVVSRVNNQLQMSALALSQKNVIQALENSLSAQSDNMNTISHELRTPLNAIMNYAQLVMRDEGLMQHARTAKFLHNIQEAARYQLQLTSNILDMAKLDAGQMALSEQVFFVQPVFDEIEVLVQGLAERHNNHLSLSRVNSLQLRNDPLRFKQVLLNLLSNACKFTKKGNIALTVSEADDVIKFQVVDDGAGISQGDQRRLFREFVQASSSVAEQFGGSGLGLALSQRLSALMGGSITLISEVGQGSTFTLSLPKLL